MDDRSIGKRHPGRRLRCVTRTLEELHLSFRAFNYRNTTMSVLLETSAGDITIDLYVDEAPKACEK